MYWIVAPPKTYVPILIPRTCEYYLLCWGKGDSATDIERRHLSWIIWVGTKGNLHVSFWKRERKTDIDKQLTHRRGGDNVTVEAEAEVTQSPLPRNIWRHQTLGEAWRIFTPGVFRGNMALWQLDFGLLASRTVRDQISIVLNQKVCSNFIQ